MQKVVHKAESRGHANHGWLDSHHTFSFAGYHNPSRMNFGALRVLNDDIVLGGGGFGAHPHDNMEIISIPLHGALEHKDNTGRNGIIKSGDVQLMSAGTGIVHSEFNHSKSESVNFLQIWIFPKVKNIKPRYEQKSFKEKSNKIQIVVSPDESDEEPLLINQDAWLSIVNINSGKSLTYNLNGNEQGVYAFVIEGEAEIEGERLKRRDGAGLWDTKSIKINAGADSKLLLIEVPMF